MRTHQTRRRFLELTVALTSVGAGRTVVAQDAEPDLELEGRTTGWQGVAPDAVADETNPTLTLVEGEEYVLEWANGDGRPHNINIEDEEGENFVSTDIISSGSQTVEFTAESGMAEYYCQPHPQSMRGSVEIVDDSEAEGAIVPGGSDGEDDDETDGEGDGEDDDETDGEGDGEDDEVDAEDAEETFELLLTEDGWEGQSPDEIGGEVNPTLEMEAGTVYEIVATTEISRAEHQTGHNLLVVNEAGREVAHTDFLTEGEEGSVVVTAEGNLSGYLDQTQLDVGGGIDVSGGETDGDGGTDDERIDVVFGNDF